MKNFSNIITLLVATLLITSCAKDYKISLITPKKVALGADATFVVNEESNKVIDSIQFFVNGKKAISSGNTLTINTKGLGFGKHIVTALSFYPGKADKKNGSFEIFPTSKPAIYNYKILNTYPHDTKAYTQGLEFYNGFLYETTGRRGQSTLRKVEIKTGKVLQKIDLPDTYFGEGMTIVNNKIYWLTWQNRKGFIYNLDTFEQEKEFKYIKSTEGWGLTHNETELIKSDGTNRIWFLDPETQKETKSIQVYTTDRAFDDLNELELVNGKIYANQYQKNAIIIINPESGIVEGIVDLRSLETEMKKTQNLVAQDEVLNGIAYDEKNNRLFVTGKNWGKLFEIELIKK